jgi:ribosomal protein L22
MSPAPKKKPTEAEEAKAPEVAEAKAEAAEAKAEAAEAKAEAAEAKAEAVEAKAEEAPAEEAPAEEAPAEEAPAEEKPKPKRTRAKKTEAEAEKPAEEKPAEEKPAAKKPAAKKPAAKESGRKRDRRPTPEPGVLVQARARYVRTSARKARLVCDHIRGKDVAEARAILAFTPRAAAKPWLKLLESAVANAEHNHELVGEELKIAAVHADEGPTLKRFRPRAMGRATRIRKRTSHLSITLTPKES